VSASLPAKLLLVQAEPVLAELTSFRLELLGYKIRVVAEGNEAIRSIEKSQPDLLIVDTELPDMDGIELINRVRARFDSEQLPLIVFSLDPSLDTVERAIQAGAQDYLIAPYDPGIIRERIEHLLLGRMMRRR
jgi:DNA-binding response OmpR family regulator